MNKIKVVSKVSFADSEYRSFHMAEDSTLIIQMKNWKEEPFQIIFHGVIQFSYKLGDMPKDLYEIIESSSFLEEALSILYVSRPLNHPYKLFQLEDLYDFPFIQVVAKGVDIHK